MRNSVQKDGERIAVIDIGSNSVRLFIFRIEAEGAEQISAMKIFCGLGKDLGTTGLLNPEAVLLTKDSLHSFRDEIDKHDVQSEIVIGTAALREAKDAGEFIRTVREETGFDIRIIEGEEEARLAALAILSFDPEASGVVADFGGGSLELAKIGQGKIERKISLRLGAHYLKALADRKRGIGAELDRALALHPEFRAPPALYVIGGSWRSLAKAWLQEKGESRADLNDFTFESADILPFCETLEKMEPEALIGRYQMEVPRAHLMDVSALMLHRLIETLSPQNVKVSTAGIRDGLAYDHILKRRAAA